MRGAAGDGQGDCELPTRRARRIVAVGCDVQSHEPVAEGLAAFGAAYERRLLAPCERDGLPLGPERVAWIAQRIAVKEAVMKCLGLTRSDPLAWTEVITGQIGSPSGSPPPADPEAGQPMPVRLLGRAAAYARRREIGVVLVASGAAAQQRSPKGQGMSSATALALTGRRTRSRAESGAPQHAHRTQYTQNTQGREHMSNAAEITETVRGVVAQHAHLTQDAAALGTEDSLYAAGMTSHASVNVMLGVEDAFDLEFPEEMLTKETFQSLAAITAAVQQLEEQE